MFFNWKFDKKFYLDSNPDVSKAKLDPYKHYLEYGKLEGRLPTRKAKLPIIDTDQICHKHKSNHFFLNLNRIKKYFFCDMKT